MKIGIKNILKKDSFEFHIKGMRGARFQYRFNMSLMSLNTSSSELQKLANKVTHIVRRETILVDSKDERTEWVKKFTEVVPFVSAKPKSKKRKIEVKAEASPTVNEIEEIIEKNAKENRKTSEWDNVGFASETGVTWVDRYRLRDYIKISGVKNSLLSAKDLCEQISDSRGRYIGPIVRAQTGESLDKANEGATGA